jgi:hypothetical protein
MNTLIAAYYATELDNWREALHQHLENIDETNEWLTEVLRFDTVPMLAARVEHHLNELLLCTKKLEQLQDNIESLETKLFNHDTPIENERITPEIKNEQSDLRQNIFDAEKEFLEIKFACNRFLADTVNEQNKMKNGEN